MLPTNHLNESQTAKDDWLAWPIIDQSQTSFFTN